MSSTKGGTSPDQVVDDSDPGDDVQRRFRYQATYSAILSLSLVNDGDNVSDITEVFCEHHEDILTKHNDDSFCGIQVKTRKSGLSPFKANEPDIFSALAKFVVKDLEFKGRFRGFLLVSNCGFWSERKTAGNLPRILKEASSVKNMAAIPERTPLRKLIRKLTTETKASERNVYKCLKRIRLDTLSHLDDIEGRLVSHLGRSPSMANRRLDELKAAAQALVAMTFRAGSLAHDSPVREYLALLPDPEREAGNAIIEGKTIRRSKVEKAIISALDADGLLKSHRGIPLEHLPRGMRRMTLKMAKGGLSVANINLAKDHKFSAEYLASEWLNKSGKARAQAMYEHIRMIVHTECQEAYDAARGDLPFGEEMLLAVRDRLKKRRDEVAESMPECRYEHLLGMAGVLTEDCDVWWSEQFTIPAESDE